LHKRLDREMLVYALIKEASRDSEIAAGYWTDEMQRRYTPAERAYVWAMLATRAARSQLPLALAWFEKSQSGPAPAPLSDDQQQWRVRAALRAGDWTAVRTSIDAMNATLRAQSAWIYWYARALAARGDQKQAQQLYTQIAGDPDFYGLLAQGELGESLRIPPRTESITADELAAAHADPGLQRATALFQNDMYLEGVREWNWSIRGMSDRQLLAAAELAQSERLWERAINTADRTVSLHDYSLRYIAPYRELFATYAHEQGLEENWVLGLVRQESRFIAHARSGAGAQGLMQVMPRTAKWIAKRMGLQTYRPSKVAEVDTNIALGTGYLRYVLDELDGSQVLAAAAYNAGPGRARRWKADQPLEGAIYIETIPFTETRRYVKKVMANAEYYAALLGGKPRGLKQRLGTIASRQGGEGYAATITGQATVQ
jgi:soluble lytic murein transglycosylase